MHERSGVSEARQVTQCGHGGHRHRALDTAQGLERLDDRMEAPGLHLRVACEFQTPQTCSRCSGRLDGCLKDQLWRGGGTDHLAEPAPVGGAPVGSPGRADIVSQHEGVEPQRGRLQVPQGLCPRSTQVADGCIVDRRDRDGGEVPRAPAPSQLPSLPTVGCDPVARPFGHQGGGDDPADRVLWRQRAIPPRATRASCVDKDQVFGLRWELPHQMVDGTLPRATSAEGDDLGVVIFGNRGDCHGFFMDIHANVERARL